MYRLTVDKLTEQHCSTQRNDGNWLNGDNVTVAPVGVYGQAGRHE